MSPYRPHHLRQSLFDDPAHGWLPALLLVMTVASGVVDAVSILTLGHVFVANMTGNLVFTGLSIGGAKGFSVVTSLVALAGFAVGVLISRRWFTSPDTHRLRLVRNAVSAELALFAAALVLSLTLPTHPAVGARNTMLVLCAVALGVQNGLIRRLAITEMTTTVLTRTVVGLLWMSKPTDPVTVRQTASLLGLIGGAVIGAALVEASGRSAALGIIVLLAAGVVAVAATTVRPQLSWT